MTSNIVGKNLATASPRRFWRTVADWLPVIAGAFAGAFAVAFPSAAAISVSVSVSVSIAFAGAVAFALVAVAVEWLGSRGRQGCALTLLGVSWMLGLLTVLLIVDTSALPVEGTVLLVILAVLPLINGLYDALSYAVTLALSRKGLSTRWAPLYGLADLLLGAVLFLALGATMVAVIQTLNALGTGPFYDLAALFTGLRASPGDYWWLYLILFSTLAPTALHILVAALAVQGWCVFRRPRRVVAGWIEAAPHSHPAAVGAFLAQATIWWLPLMLLAGLGWALWQMIGTAASVAGLFYLGLLENLGRWVGAV